MNSVGSNNLSLKYQRFTPQGRRDVGIRTFDLVAKTQFLKSTTLQLYKIFCLKILYLVLTQMQMFL